MNINRIKDLQYFTRDFYDKLQLAEKKYHESRNNHLSKGKGKEKVLSLSPPKINGNRKPMFVMINLNI